MSAPAEFHDALLEFPLVLRTLAEAELAAGNRIVELGHGFPAPPVGAYIMLANPVSTQPRATGAELNFYERNGSSYSGEFTDAKQFFFVLEAPHPPETEPDMDAIRRALAADVKAVTRNSTPTAHERHASATDTASGAVGATAFAPTSPSLNTSLHAAVTIDESSTGWTRVLHFRDRRPPHDVQVLLEKTLMSLFTPYMDDQHLCYHATATVVGAFYEFELRFEAALPETNAFSLRVFASWQQQSAEHFDYYRKTSVSWFESWTRSLQPGTQPDTGAGSVTRYSELANDALQAESSLDSVSAIQQAIVSAMHRGGFFSDSNKEGDTRIFWRDGRFNRVDTGEYPDHRRFADDTEFLKSLRQFWHVNITRTTGAQPRSEFDAWKLILRMLRR